MSTKSRQLTTISFWFLSIFGPSNAIAHHSAAAYDMTKQVVIEGTVTDVVWRNPHMSFTIETLDSRGEAILQEFEGLSVSESVAIGLPRDTIKEGDHVFVRAYPGRRGLGSMALGIELTTGDGKLWTLYVNENTKTRATVKADSIAGRWSPSPAEFTATIATMLNWPYNAKARNTLNETWGQPGSTLGYCVDLAPPLLSIFLDLREIEVVDDSLVKIWFEAQGQPQERLIHMDLAAHPADIEPSALGHSIGWWEGETLVIDTMGFSPNGNGIMGHIESGPDKHMIEKLALTEDGYQLRYELMLEEPLQLVEPASFTVLWDHRPDLEPTGVACDYEVARRLVEDTH